MTHIQIMALTPHTHDFQRRFCLTSQSRSRALIPGPLDPSIPNFPTTPPLPPPSQAQAIAPWGLPHSAPQPSQLCDAA